ncbi:hypothetical protein [Shewanella sp.]|uniref:hypothetical protein n=1 Tax=Shewanella sp. TaxID=50422 RepID=UPI001EB10381|nr:hypothetical protein [Shewanella sp.]NRB24062.1 hypothetical protein [Shewanella sp.]
MNSALVQTIKPTQMLSAANSDEHIPAGAAAIRAMRLQLGRNTAASLYSKLSNQQKAIILFGARLKPSSHIHIPLESMSFDEQEQVRLSIIALRDMAKTFVSIPLSRDQFVTSKISTPDETSNKELAAQLAQSMTVMDRIGH